MKYLEDADFTLYNGDALEVLRGFPAESVHMCVTSPPYWGLRDYSAEGQLGLEPTPDLYIERMVAVFREVRRVLRSDGTCWVNMGSSYFQGDSYPLSNVDAAWLAALIDGEGCIQIHQQKRPERTNSVDSFQIDLSVGMLTPELVQRAHELTGLGSCGLQNRGVWDWSVRGQQTARLLRALYPYLLTKKRQAAIAVMLGDDLAARKYGRGNPAQPEVMEWRAAARKAVSDLNHRLETDFEIREPTPIALGLKPKDNTLMPARLALALQADGWYVRSDIVWGKLNPMPESVTDRPTTSHEFVYLLAKSPRYFFDQEAVREPHITAGRNGGTGSHGRIGEQGWKGGTPLDPAGRNLRSVWEIATQPYPEAHFATYPEELVRRCILAGSSERGCCPECGAPWQRAGTLVTYDSEGRTTNGPRSLERRHETAGFAQRLVRNVSFEGWRPDCACYDDLYDRDFPKSSGRWQRWTWHDRVRRRAVPERFRWPVDPCVVADIFLGSGTTALVARKHGRRTIGIELSAEYCELASRRLSQLSLLAEGAV